MSTRTIRPLLLEDIAILRMIDDLAHGEAWSRQAYAEDIAGADRLHLVVEIGPRIVGHGAAWFDGATCRITNVAVLSGCEGKGHAAAVLHALLSEAVALGVSARAELEVRPRNRRAQRLYSRFGFVPIGVERGFYPRSDEHGNHDAMVMAIDDLASSSWRQRLDRLTRTLGAAA